MNRKERRAQFRRESSAGSKDVDKQPTPRLTSHLAPHSMRATPPRVLASRLVLTAFLGIYFCLTLAMIARVPLGAAPDENAHLDYVEYVATQFRLPVFHQTPAPSYGYEFHQPPFYYLVCAPVWKTATAIFGKTASGKNAAGYGCRLISLACGVLALWLLWDALAFLIEDENSRATLQILSVGLGALWPLHIGVGASAANDALAGLMCAGVFWSVARMAARAEYSLRDAALIGIFFGLGMLTKSSCLPVGVAGVGAAFFIMRCKASTHAATQAALVAWGVAVLICGAWLARNQILYGDVLAARAFDAAFSQSSPRPRTVMAAMHVNILEYIRAFTMILFTTCWGIFSGPNMAIKALNPFSKPVPADLAAAQGAAVLQAAPLILACVAATALAAWGWTKNRFAAFRMANAGARKIGFGWWLIGFILVALALFRFNLIYFQAQARYLHPALLPMCLLFALGWKNIWGERRALWIFAAVFGLVLLAITLWNVIFWQTLV